ncbi:MAG: rhomboid family intramembrane serine protease [Chloroflexota bacterium]
MIPIQDQNPRHRFPAVTVTLIALNFVAFVLQFPALQELELWVPFANRWALIPSQLTSAIGAEFYTVFTSMFLHGSIMHILGNMLYLWIFGDNIEDKLGRGRFIFFYLLCGVIAALAHVMIDPNSQIPTIGASGAVAGVLGGYLLLFPMVRVTTMIPILLFRRFQIPAWILLGLWFVMQLFSGVSQSSETAGVAFWAHIGGFAAGFLLVRLIGPTHRMNEEQMAYLNHLEEREAR